MAANDPDEAPGGGEDPRLSSLDERLKAAQQAEAERTALSSANSALSGKGVPQGNRVLSTLIGAPLGSVAVGYVIDRLFGTFPAALLTMLFLGVIAAGVQIWRISQERPE